MVQVVVINLALLVLVLQVDQVALPLESQAVITFRDLLAGAAAHLLQVELPARVVVPHLVRPGRLLLVVRAVLKQVQQPVEVSVVLLAVATVVATTTLPA